MTIQFTDEIKLELLRKNGWRSRRIDGKWIFGQRALSKRWLTFAEAWAQYEQERARRFPVVETMLEQSEHTPHKLHLFEKLRRRYAEYESAVQAGDDLSMQNAMNAIMDEIS